MEQQPKDLKGVSETLFIPLYGRAQMSKNGWFFTDKKAEEIVSEVGYDFTKNKRSVFLDIYMSIRAAKIDNHAERFITENPDTVVLHLGCGLDSRAERIFAKPKLWYDLDFPDVISARKRYFKESESYRMIASSVTDLTWLNHVEETDSPVLVIAEGLTMYLTEEENKALILALQKKFRRVQYLFDAYSLLSVRLSQKSNPVNRMGAVIRWGLDTPSLVEAYGSGIRHLTTEYFNNDERLKALPLHIKVFFRLMFCNNFAKEFYRIYTFTLNQTTE